MTNIPNTIFVTGTDTDVGKTVVTELLMQSMSNSHKRVLGFKPISAGCQITEHGLRNDDALALQRASNINIAYDCVNPIAFEPAIAPHIAADLENVEIDLPALASHLNRIQTMNAEILFVEGAGGWRLPLNNAGLFLSDFVKAYRMPVLLVVGMRLGCLNHALLTVEAIKRDGLNVVGWIANECAGEMPFYEHNLQSLETLIEAPLLAEVRHSSSPKLAKTDAFQRIFI